MFHFDRTISTKQNYAGSTLLKNKIILVGGYCATGKSTFARELSKRLELPCFVKDAIKEVIGEGFGAENTEVHIKNSKVTFLLMLAFAESFLQVGKSCVLESNFKKLESEQIKTLLEKYNCECLTFIFKGDLDVLYDRYIDRDNAGKRHWVHRLPNESRERFREGHLRNGIGEISIGRTIEIDATTFENIDYEKLFILAEDFLLN